MQEQPGGWNALLFVGDFNRNQPESVTYSSADPTYAYQEVYIVDGGEIYGRQAAEFVLRPAIGTSENAYIQLFDISKYVITPPYGSPYQLWMFDNKSNSFIGVTNIMGVFLNGAADAGSVYKIFESGGAFNPSRMKADLVYMAKGGLPNHLLAVMEDSEGTLFLADLNLLPEANGKMAFAKYDLSNLEGINEAFAYAFVENSPSGQCYYATADAVYEFFANGENLTPESRQLDLTPSGNKITLLKSFAVDGSRFLAIASLSPSGEGELVIADAQSPNRILRTYQMPGQISDVCIKHI